MNSKLGWLGSNGRPDIAAGNSIIAGNYKHKNTALITDCNHCVKMAKETKVVMKIWGIPVSDLRMVVFVDSSFDFIGERHQQGWLIGFTNQYLTKNQSAPV